MCGRMDSPLIPVGAAARVPVIVVGYQNPREPRQHTLRPYIPGAVTLLAKQPLHPSLQKQTSGPVALNLPTAATL